ncbi:ATP-binding protein [Streptomyces sp. RKAG293]|uniref:ATP-binding protein n=1 Tax=Streptomyces sp. RKAG293 TaxID=2893403 RepID=UPI00203365AB|nr:ATP-binding protein [Streptomyces sp. RKAG293]MCM2419632.1 ATP-binding protein [Streptomyces sp. RKAG293]
MSLQTASAWPLDGCAAPHSYTLFCPPLITNAYQHAKGAGSLLWLAVEAAYVRITVYDGTPDPPVVVPAGCEEEGGRGLLLVAALADDWGTVGGAPLGPVAGEGKGGWFTLARAA